MVDEDFSGVTKLPSLGAMWSTKTWKFVNRRISEANSYLRDLDKEQNIVSIDLANEFQPCILHNCDTEALLMNLGYIAKEQSSQVILPYPEFIPEINFCTIFHFLIDVGIKLWPQPSDGFPNTTYKDQDKTERKATKKSQRVAREVELADQRQEVERGSTLDGNQNRDKGELPRGSITTWNELCRQFLNRFFPPFRKLYLKDEIYNFKFTKKLDVSNFKPEETRYTSEQHYAKSENDGHILSITTRSGITTTDPQLPTAENIDDKTLAIELKKVDFIVSDCEIEIEMPIILGKSFMAIGRDMVYMKKVHMEPKAVKNKMVDTSRIRAESPEPSGSVEEYLRQRNRGTTIGVTHRVTRG
ncbi:hypothetical protein FXO38_35447 [Capsicum annuum]|nr:hypothetical protein FXO38_35447 [Capsicum annuum]